MSGEEFAGTQKAAALHGVAINVAYNFRERFDAALEALVIYEVEYGKLWEGHEAISGVDLGGLSADQSFALGKLTGELMKLGRAHGHAQGLRHAVTALLDSQKLGDWLNATGFDPNDPSNWVGEGAIQMLAQYLASFIEAED